MWCSVGCPNGPELFTLYYVMGGSVINITLLQNCKWILLHVKTNCSSSSFPMGIQKNPFAKSVALCHRPEALLICSSNVSTFHTPAVIVLVIGWACGISRIHLVSAGARLWMKRKYDNDHHSSFLFMSLIFATLLLLHNVIWFLICHLGQWSQIQRFPITFSHNNSSYHTSQEPSMGVTPIPTVSVPIVYSESEEMMTMLVHRPNGALWAGL